MTTFTRLCSVRVPMLLAVGVLAGLFLTGCSENDASKVALTINADFSGKILASRVIIADTEKAAEAFPGITGGGVRLAAGATVAVTAGTFADLASLRVGEVTFEVAARNSGKMIKVLLPRGKNVRWPAMLTEISDERRIAAADALDPANGKDTKVGKNATFTITVPGKVLGSAASQRARGLAATSEEVTATLIVPVAFATADGEPLVWHVTWE